ncbi:hypothetical protein ONE63_000075 [Megalurothrips usitatus]|uniref:Sulfotransferase domain-containing protein n=1 Tax=Megalurothrips usitatus TaxID=439358 RepID=A0AAV7XZT9_9NEOP|nr:hypothetical protein ONE63_000075 [Megalurothrips usitatus]
MSITCSPLEPGLAERLFKLFGRTTLMEVRPGGLTLPARYGAVSGRIRGLAVRPDDVWVVSYPRTGSTWTQEMVWCIGNDLDFTRAVELQQYRAPLIEMAAVGLNDGRNAFGVALGDSVSRVTDMPSPRFIKSHLTWDLLPEQLCTVRPKVVYVARDPKDLCVSYYHYCRLAHGLDGPFQDFAELFLQGGVPYGSAWSHILSFWARRNDPNLLFLKYEDMKKDLPSQIRRTAEFLGKQIGNDDIRNLIEYLSFDRMRDNPAVNFQVVLAGKYRREGAREADVGFIRKGQVGDYKNYMTEDMIARFDMRTRETFAASGLSFD